MNPSKTKIAVVSTNSDEAGAPRHCEMLINALANEFDFVFYTGEEGAVASRLKKNISVYVDPNLRSKISPIRDMKAIYFLLRFIIAERPDVLHLHSTKAGMIGRIAALLTRKRVIYTVHGFGWRGMSWPKASIIWLIEALLVYVPQQKVVVVSDELATISKKMLRISKSKVNVIHNGCPDVVSPPKYTRVADQDVLRILMPARVDTSKDHVTLFRAVSLLSVDFELLLCGAGTDTEAFIDVARVHAGKGIQKIKFLGQRSDVQDLLEQSDLVILISNFEALPLSIIEGMRAGLPIIATNIGGIPEMVDSSCGELVAKGCHEEVAQALMRFCDPSVRVTAGKSSRRTYEEKFSLRLMKQKLRPLYQDF